MYDFLNSHSNHINITTLPIFTNHGSSSPPSEENSCSLCMAEGAAMKCCRCHYRQDSVEPTMAIKNLQAKNIYALSWRSHCSRKHRIF